MIQSVLASMPIYMLSAVTQQVFSASREDFLKLIMLWGKKKRWRAEASLDIVEETMPTYIRRLTAYD